MKKIIGIALLSGVAGIANAQQYADGGDGVTHKTLPPPMDSALIGAPYLDVKRPLEERVDDLFNRLTDEEKAEIIHGASGYTYGKMPRIGLSEFVMSDGPQGVRLGGKGTATGYPCGLAMAASWNLDAIAAVGKSIAEECKATNTRIILGPGVNIMRTPLGGRNFEYFGEDPYLAGMTAVGYVRGVQGEGIATSIKHWLLNDQEWARTVIDVDVPERALREIYARPYEVAIKQSNPWTVMPSYNRVRGLFSTHNRVLNDILYKDYGYDGALISDWGAWRDDKASIEGGCTICMPSGKDLKRNKAIAEDVKSGKINRADFDEAVKRNIRFALRVGAFNRVDNAEKNTPQQQLSGRQLAEESMVLLKNNGILPLDTNAVKKIAVIGPNADEFQSMVDGRDVHDGKGGAGATRGPYEITPLQGIVKMFGEENVLFAPGFWFRPPKKKSFPQMPEMDPVAAAKAADMVIFVGGTDHTYDKEKAGWGIMPEADKPDINLKGDQVSLLKKVIAANPKTIVVLINGAPVQVEEWQADVPAILEAWYGGQDAGHVIADILTGKVNPSGKLPCTFGKQLTDWPCHTLGEVCYPGIPSADNKMARQYYADSIWVGYRGFDKFNAVPRYPFGFGLSYTTFKIEKSAQDNNNLTVKVTNTGKRDGAEVVQFYITKPAVDGVEMPVRELVGFEKVFLKPGELKEVTFTLTDEMKRYWCEKENGWKVPSGRFIVTAGNSSRDAQARAEF